MKMVIPRAAFINALESELEKRGNPDVYAYDFMSDLLEEHLDGNNEPITVEFDEDEHQCPRCGNELKYSHTDCGYDVYKCTAENCGAQYDIKSK